MKNGKNRTEEDEEEEKVKSSEKCGSVKKTIREEPEVCAAPDSAASKFVSGQKKAKLRRLERKQEKLRAKGKLDAESSGGTKKALASGRPKSLGDLIPSSNTDTAGLNVRLGQVMPEQFRQGEGEKHRLELRLVKASPEDGAFMEYFGESYQVYR